ncbi:hypothetical protein PRIPAC_90381 [Pristionchus pacificus]|uniref:Uncharacterized protein n=1 Tax=Pristionchus pacificus TaxID=54126 RepID=A0A2A6B6N3_PRIPA|nr:hypothetical protein PRIPAC_90381 [Pristionchus pacificus]|eukprot:PDM61536.1 hypothetical protein PRIPAC_50978 [Pristionchus pacificus]
MSNVTVHQCPINYLTALKTAMYVPLGGGAALTNFVLLAAILRKRSLRTKREYILTAALAFADFVEGLATFIGGVYRLPHVYSTTMCAFYVVFFAIAWIKPISMTVQDKKVPAVCGTSGFIDQTLVQVTKYVGSVGSALSVIISLVVAVKIREFMAKIEMETVVYSKTGEKHNGSARRQLKFTITTLIKGLCTLVLDSFPRSFGVYAMIREQIDGYNPESGGIGSFFFILTKVNAMLNVFIYALRQPEWRINLIHDPIGK